MGFRRKASFTQMVGVFRICRSNLSKFSWSQEKHLCSYSFPGALLNCQRQEKWLDSCVHCSSKAFSHQFLLRYACCMGQRTLQWRQDTKANLSSKPWCEKGFGVWSDPKPAALLSVLQWEDHSDPIFAISIRWPKVTHLFLNSAY